MEAIAQQGDGMKILIDPVILPLYIKFNSHETLEIGQSMEIMYELLGN